MNKCFMFFVGLLVAYVIGKSVQDGQTIILTREQYETVIENAHSVGVNEATVSTGDPF